MRIKTEKHDERKVTDVIIRGIDCTTENVFKIVSLLNLKDIFTIVSSVEASNPFLERIEALALNYTTSIPVHNDSFIDAVLVADINNFETILSYTLKCDPDIVFLTSMSDSIQWDQYLYDIKHYNGRELIKYKLSKACVSIMIDEYKIAIWLDPEVYDVHKIYSDIKALF